MELAHKLTSTRAGTISLAALAALLAGVSILVYLNKYRHSVSAGGAPVTVLVAKQTISKGTPGEAIASSGLFTTRTIRESQLRDGAISDPVNLRDKVAAENIYVGQQLVASDFVAGSSSIASSLTKSERLISIPIDSAHGLIGTVQAGDHVDIYAGFNVQPLGPDGQPRGAARQVLKMIMQNIAVVSVGGKTSGVGTAASSANVGLRASATQSEELAFASDNGKIWLVLRPTSGAKLAKPGLVTVETMLLGIPPVTVMRSLGAH